MLTNDIFPCDLCPEDDTLRIEQGDFSTIIHLNDEMICFRNTTVLKLARQLQDHVYSRLKDTIDEEFDNHD